MLLACEISLIPIVTLCYGNLWQRQPIAKMISVSEYYLPHQKKINTNSHVFKIHVK